MKLYYAYTDVCFVSDETDIEKLKAEAASYCLEQFGINKVDKHHILMDVRELTSANDLQPDNQWLKSDCLLWGADQDISVCGYFHQKSEIEKEYYKAKELYFKLKDQFEK